MKNHDLSVFTRSKPRLTTGDLSIECPDHCEFVRVLKSGGTFSYLFSTTHSPATWNSIRSQLSSESWCQQFVPPTTPPLRCRPHYFYNKWRQCSWWEIFTWKNGMPPDKSSDKGLTFYSSWVHCRNRWARYVCNHICSKGIGSSMSAWLRTLILKDWVRSFLWDHHNAISTESTYLVFVAALKMEVSPPIS